MNTPYNNEAHYDAGRFRFKLTFFKLASIVNASGGSVPTLQQLITTHAAQEKISERSQLAIEAGASVLNQDCYFIIRYRKDFYPEKDMVVYVGGATYVIRAVIPIDVPICYVKLLCVKKDFELTT